MVRRHVPTTRLDGGQRTQIGTVRCAAFTCPTAAWLTESLPPVQALRGVPRRFLAFSAEGPRRHDQRVLAAAQRSGQSHPHLPLQSGDDRGQGCGGCGQGSCGRCSQRYQAGSCSRNYMRGS
jgi:hypothetical protein